MKCRAGVLLVTISLFVLAMGLLRAQQKAGAADVANGKAVYEDSCLNCHAANGEGDKATEKKYKVKLKALGDSEVQSKSDEQLGKESSEGVGKMKPVDLSPQEIVDVVAYVRTLKK